MTSSLARHLLAAALLFTALLPVRANEPYVGQPGKDVVWVPNPEEMVVKRFSVSPPVAARVAESPGRNGVSRNRTRLRVPVLVS